MTLPIPRVSASTVCCPRPSCRQLVGFGNDGRPSPHWTRDGWLCPSSFPEYFTGAGTPPAVTTGGGPTQVTVALSVPLPLHAQLDLAARPAEVTEA